MTDPLHIPASTLHRIHLARQLVKLCSHLELTPNGRQDALYICNHAGRARQLITDWAWTTGKGTAADKADDGCRSCARLGTWEPTAEGRYKMYCRWCGEWFAAHDSQPPEHILAKHHRGERITSRDLERINTRRTA